MRSLAISATLAVPGAAGCPTKAIQSSRDRRRRRRRSRADVGDAGPPRPSHEDEAEQHEELPTQGAALARGRERGGHQDGARRARTACPRPSTSPARSPPIRIARPASRPASRAASSTSSAKEGDRVKAGQTIAVLESPELARARATLASALGAGQGGAPQRRPTQEPGGQVPRVRPGGRPPRRRRRRRSRPRSPRPSRRWRRSGRARTQAHGARRARHASAPRSPASCSAATPSRARPSTPSTSSPSSAISSTSTSSAACSRRISRASQVGASAEVRLNAYPSEVFDGKIETIGRQLDPAARTVTARILVAQPRRPGEGRAVRHRARRRSVDGRDAGQARGRPARRRSPASRTRTWCSCASPTATSSCTRSTLGRSAGGRVEILSGLRAGEQVVVDGVFTLKSAILKSTFGEEE